MKTASTLRFPIILLVALLITSAMFMLLQNLTTTSFTIVSKKTVPIEWKRVLVDTPIEVKSPPKPELIPPPIVVPPQIITEGGGPPEKIKPRVEPLKPPAEFGKGATSGNAYDSDVVPVLRIDPAYPPRLQESGIEGWVRVRFNISATGSVTDVTVVASEPTGSFDKATIDAVTRWRYNPKVQDGVAVERRGVETRLSFKLQSQ